MKIPPLQSKINTCAGLLTLLVAGSIFFMPLGEGEIGTSVGEKLYRVKK